MSDEKKFESKIPFEVIDVVDGDNSIRITGYNDEHDVSGDLVIRYKKMDPVSHSFVDDAATMDAANDALAELFGNGSDGKPLVTIKLLRIDPEGALPEDATFEGYYFDGTIRQYPPHRSQRFDSLGKTKGAENAAKKFAANASFPMFTGIVTETNRHGLSNSTGRPYAMFQFETGVEIEVEGEPHKFRISTLAHLGGEDGTEVVDRTAMTYVPTGRGEGLAVADKYTKLDTNQVDGKKAEVLKRVADDAVTRMRSATVSRMKELYNLDIDALLKSDQGIKLSGIQVARAGTNPYIIGIVADDQLPLDADPDAVSAPDGAAAAADDDDDLPF